jgi:hypothetical protein
MSGHIPRVEFPPFPGFPGLPGLLPLGAVGTHVPPCTHGVGENVKKYTMIDGGQEIDIVRDSSYCTLIRDAKTNNLIALDPDGIFTLVDNDGISIRFKEHDYNPHPHPHPHPHPRHAFKKSRSKKSRSKKSRSKKSRSKKSRSKKSKKSKGTKKSKGAKKSN